MAARLQPVPELPGVWRPEEVPEPGTFAFIVGVSAYRYLDGSKESLTLGQLAVSALTAYQLFRYFADAYRHRVAPIAEVTLLLAPTTQEQQLFDTQPDYPITRQTAPLPTLATLCEALQTWYARLAALEPEAAKLSRLFFFFSGHGLELAPSQQLLLPHDYPGPARMFNNAIGTENIHAGLGALPIAEQFFFIDACRNDIASLHELAMTAGVPALDVRRRQLNRAAPILWASAPGASTFQPDEAQDLQTSSFFGHALLDALLLRDAAFRPDCRSGPCKIDFFPLVDYANASMAQRLSAPGSAPVTAGGIVRNVTVSHVAPPAAPQPAVAGASEPRARRMMASTPRAHAPMPVGTAAAVAPAPVDVGAAMPVTAANGVQPATRGGTESHPLGEITLDAHDLERMLRAGQIFMWDEEWLDAGPAALQLAGQRWGADDRALELAFRFERTDRWYLVLFEHDGIAYAAIFPAGFAEDPLFSLTIDIGAPRQPDGNTIANVRASLSSDNMPELASAFAEWNPAGSLLRTSAADASWSPDRLDALLDRAPLAGTLVVLGLLRRGEFDRLRPLLERFTRPQLPMSDLPVVGLRLMGVQSEWEEGALRRCLAAIAELGIPATHEAGHYLVSFLLNDLGASDGGGGSFGEEHLRAVALEAAAEARPMLDDFSRVGPVMRSGGLFVTLVTPSERMPTYIRIFE